MTKHHNRELSGCHRYIIPRNGCRIIKFHSDISAGSGRVGEGELSMANGKRLGH
jgi:hypothetical protein